MIEHCRGCYYPYALDVDGRCYGCAIDYIRSLDAKCYMK